MRRVTGSPTTRRCTRTFPALIEYYLGEKRCWPTCRTYRACRRGRARRSRSTGSAELVTKPVDGYGGDGVLIGPDASARGARAPRARRSARPAPLDRAGGGRHCRPTRSSTGRALETAHVDLRAFVYLTGPGAEQATVADLALTRVAPAGSMVVNSRGAAGPRTPGLLTEPYRRRSADMCGLAGEIRFDGAAADRRSAAARCTAPAGPARPGRRRASGRPGRSRSAIGG